MIHVYTGMGKGKTTAALGLAMRALGHGLKVYIIQFMKGNIRYGELETARQLSPNIVIKQMGRECFVDRDNPDKIDIELAQRAFQLRPGNGDVRGKTLLPGRHSLQEGD